MHIWDRPNIDMFAFRFNRQLDRFVSWKPDPEAECVGAFAVTWSDLYTERKKKNRVNFIPKCHSSLKKFVKYFTMITKRYMYGTKVPNFIGL